MLTKNFNAIFVVSEGSASFWKVFIKFHWHGQKLAGHHPKIFTTFLQNSQSGQKLCFFAVNNMKQEWKITEKQAKFFSRAEFEQVRSFFVDWFPSLRNVISKKVGNLNNWDQYLSLLLSITHTRKRKCEPQKKPPGTYLNKFSFISTLRKIYFILDLELLQIAIVKSALDLHPIILWSSATTVNHKESKMSTTLLMNAF